MAKITIELDLPSLYELSEKRSKTVIKEKSQELNFDELMAAIYYQGVIDVLNNHPNVKKDMPGFEGTIDALNKIKI